MGDDDDDVDCVGWIRYRHGEKEEEGCEIRCRFVTTEINIKLWI